MSATTVGIERTPLESWIAGRLAVSAPALTRENIAQYQLKALEETIQWARNHSTFYAQHFQDLRSDLPCSLHEMSLLPLTSPEDVVSRGHEFLCVSQDEISRIVTLNSSGTSGPPKRIFFTAEDQELAVDFFGHGVAAMASRGDRMLIALPGEREGSVGYQLAKGISRAGVIPIPHGFSIDTAETLEHMEQERATSIIGLPVQVLALARRDSALADRVFHRLRSIVLCSDHVPESIVDVLRQRSGVEVFEHYGSTEMGLAGGVDCEAHMGYHLRETDLYFEVISPETGESLPDGEMGEVVFTTLHHTGMPLIRFRTGDLSRFLPGPCGCGSIIRRLERVQNRIDGFVPLKVHGSISISALDEALFAIPQLLDFTASVILDSPFRMRVTVFAPGVGASPLIAAVRRALLEIPSIAQNCAMGELEIDVIFADEAFPATGAKRKIEVHASR